MAQPSKIKGLTKEGTQRLGQAVGFFGKALSVRFLLLFLLTLLMTFAVSSNITSREYNLKLGDFTTYSIRAPHAITVVDDETTEAKRDEAYNMTLPVARIDTQLTIEIKRRIAEAFAPVRAVFKKADQARNVPDEALAKLSKSKKAALIEKAQSKADGILEKELPPAIADFEKALGFQLNPADKKILTKLKFDKAAEEALIALIESLYSTPLVNDKAAILAEVEGDDEKGEGPGKLSVLNSKAGTEELLEDLTKIRTLREATDSLDATAEKLLPGFPKGERNLLVNIAKAQAVPNLFLDTEETRKRRELAAQSVIPISLSFKKNQLIVGEGQEVKRDTLLVLEALSDERSPNNSLSRTFGSAILVYMLILLGFWIFDLNDRHFVVTDQDFIFVTTGLVMTLIVFKAWLALGDLFQANYPQFPEMAFEMLFPIAVLAMYTRFLLKFPVALLQSAIVAILSGLVLQSNLYYTTYAFVVGLVGAHMVGRAARRGDILIAGLWTGLASAAGAACLVMIRSDLILTDALWVVGAALGSGLLAGFAVVAISPVAEWLFGYTTSTSLLEMANYEHPLLRQIMIKTPGTFQHSVSIGILAEAAAKAVGANTLLIRVGALYHDSGKSENPQFFVENQVGFNPHDELEPMESAKILLSHVLDGVTLVRKHGLGERIADFVREHHGTGQIKYFLNKAQQSGGEVNPADYQYAGPKPRSKETGIMMIADQVEATSRTMEGATEKEFSDMVGRTIERIRSEGQLDECPLTLQDLALIHTAFLQILMGLHHQRIKYPGQENVGSKKGKKQGKWLRRVR